MKDDMIVKVAIRGICLIGLLCLVSRGTAIGEGVTPGVEMNGTWHEKTGTRERFCLNGEWQFYPLAGTSKDDWQAPPVIGEVDSYAWEMNLRVPDTWKGGDQWGESQFFSDAGPFGFGGIIQHCLRAWYKRSFFVPAEWDGQEITLEFGGVGYKAAVYINRQYADTHIGTFSPFEVNITRLVKPGQVNEILVYNASSQHGWERPKEGPIVHPSGMGGIWGDVYLRANCRFFTNDVFVKTSVRNKEITAVSEIVNKDGRSRTVIVESVVTDNGQNVLVLPAREITVPAGIGMVKAETTQAWLNPRYWSLEDPHLYYLNTRITEAGNLIDEKTTRFGFREFWIDGRDFRLNGEIVRLRNFPVVLLGPAQMRPEYVRGWFKLMKDKLHHNCIRFQNIPAGIYPEMADEVGLLIEEGTGFVGGDERVRWNWPEANAQTKKEVGEWVRIHRNHPSIVIWSAENECWSMKSVKMYRDGDPESIGIYKWLLDIRDWIKEHDDTRVITYHEVGDMFDWTKNYFEENFEAADLMGAVDNYNLHYPRHFRFTAEEAEIGARWAKEKNKPLLVGEFGGPKTGVPSTGTDFVIGGEECVRGGVSEGKSNYYLFRRVVGAWRSAGMSGIYPWMPNLYSVKTTLVNHKFAWDDLTTPYFKPFSIRSASYNPGWDKSKPEYIPDNTYPASNYRMWDMLADSFSPLLINLGGNYWEHNYLSVEKITKQVSIVNDTPDGQEVTWSWSLEEGGKRLTGGTQTLKLARAEIKELSFDVQLPEVKEQKEFVLRLTAIAKESSSNDSLDINVHPAVSITPPEFPGARVALYDKVGKTAEVLDKAGIHYERLNKIIGELKAKKQDILIVGCDSADQDLTATVMDVVPVSARDVIRRFVEEGGKVLVFEQGRDTYNNLNLIFPGITAPAIEHGSPSYAPCSYAGIAAPGHPIFNGFKKGIMLWKGEYGRISEFNYPRPLGARATPLLFSGKWGASLIEGVYGTGRYLLCQVNISTRYGQDPEATILMHNMLSYILSPAPVVNAKAATVGEIGGLLGSFAADNITGKLSETDLTKYNVFILGRDTMTADSEVAGNTGKILKFVKDGGTVFALPQNPGKFKSDWLPGKLAVRDMASQYILKEDTTEPVLWGVSAFDLTQYYSYYGVGNTLANAWAHPKVEAELYGFSPDWTSLLFVSREPETWDICSQKEVGGISPTGGSAMLQTRYGKGRIILCQIALDKNCGPVADEVLADAESLPKLGPRLVADTLLVNLGLARGRGAGQEQGANTAYSVDKDTVLLVHFDQRDGDTVKDESGNGNNGIMIGSALTAGSGGRFGEGVQTSPKTGIVEVKDNKSLDITGQITVESWFKPSIDYPSTPPEWRGLVTKGYSNGESYGLSYECWTGRLQFAIRDGDKRYAAITPMELKSGTWYHIAGTYDGDTIRLFVNGLMVASEVHKGSITPDDMPLWIGSGAPNSRNFNGVIDEVRISNKARY